MTTTITTIYEKGVLRPLTPLSVPEHARVLIQIQEVSPPEAPSAHRRRIREVLMAAGLMLLLPVTPATASPLTPERCKELARLFAVGQPLSELIIEEREARYG